MCHSLREKDRIKKEKPSSHKISAIILEISVMDLWRREKSRQKEKGIN
jgi:hypothetical protein